MKRLVCLVLLGAVSCTGRTDHERLGDRRYAEQAWVDALAEYRLAARQRRPSVELRVKIGTAALNAGALGEAAAAWRDLAAADHAARDEAAEGLVRTARAAIAARDVSGLRAALMALLPIAPERLPELGPLLAMGLEERHGSDSGLILVAAALSRGPTVDSLAALWADAAARAGACVSAVSAYQSVARRASTPGVTRAARIGLAGCHVEEGRLALSAGNLEEAELSFLSAVAIGIPDSTVRLAWVLIGDARWANGDTAQAVEAYGKAITNAAEDNPIAQRAREQLDKLTGGNPPIPEG